MTDADPNYRYWQEHGGVWAREYDERKHRIPLYHIQEIMLAEYMAAHADISRSPKVLEFGCGVGRHLRNMVRIPGIDVYGFDQSPTMLASCRAWAEDTWIESHITLGEPIGRLPYADATFDIVYSTEVLVHVRPEHLQGVLSELLRICKGHVLHLEPAPGVTIHSDVHSGCWVHDVQAAYAALGMTCEVFEGGYQAHAPYRVVKGCQPAFMWEPWRLEMYRTCERMLSAGLAASDSARTMAEDALAVARIESEAIRANLAGCEQREIAVKQLMQGVEAQRDQAMVELAGIQRQAQTDLDNCRTEAAAQLRESERRHLAALEQARTTAHVELEAARHDWQKELARTRDEAEERQRLHFEPLLAEAHRRIEQSEREFAALQRDLMTVRLMREDLSTRIVSQQARIDDLSATLRTLNRDYDLFTASVKSIVDPKEKPIP